MSLTVADVSHFRLTDVYCQSSKITSGSRLRHSSISYRDGPQSTRNFFSVSGYQAHPAFAKPSPESENFADTSLVQSTPTKVKTMILYWGSRHSSSARATPSHASTAFCSLPLLPSTVLCPWPRVQSTSPPSTPHSSQVLLQPHGAAQEWNLAGRPVFNQTTRHRTRELNDRVIHGQRSQTGNCGVIGRTIDSRS